VISSSQVNFGWTASTDTGGSGLAGYKIYKKGLLGDDTASTSYSVTSLSASTTYSFTVAGLRQRRQHFRAECRRSATTQAVAARRSPSLAFAGGDSGRGLQRASPPLRTTPYTGRSARQFAGGMTLSSGGVLSGTTQRGDHGEFHRAMQRRLYDHPGIQPDRERGVINYTSPPVPASRCWHDSPNAQFFEWIHGHRPGGGQQRLQLREMDPEGTTVSTSPSYSFQPQRECALLANFTPCLYDHRDCQSVQWRLDIRFGQRSVHQRNDVSLTATPATATASSTGPKTVRLCPRRRPTATATANRALVATRRHQRIWEFLVVLCSWRASSDDGRAVAVDKRDGSCPLTGDFTGPVISGSGSGIQRHFWLQCDAGQVRATELPMGQSAHGNGVSQGQAVAVDATQRVCDGYFRQLDPLPARPLAR